MERMEYCDSWEENLTEYFIWYILSIYRTINKIIKNMHSTTIINIKTDPKIKTKAQKTATDLGLTLSSVINGYLKQFVRTKTVHFSLNTEKPNPYLISALEEAKKDRLEKKHYTFKNNKQALDFLDKQ